MKRLLLHAGLVLTALVFFACGKKDDALLLPLGIQATQSAAAPSVPQEDLVPVNNGSAGTGNVSAITGDSATPGGGSSGDSSGSSGGSSGSSGGSSGSSGGSAGSSGDSSGSSGDSSGSSGDSSGSSGDSSGSSGGSSGSSGGSSGSSGDSSGSSGDSSGSSGGSSGSSGGAPALNTSASFTGKDYSHVDGKWYLDGTTLFTYDKNNSVGFTMENMQAGTYQVTIEAKHWVKHGESQGLPSGFSSYQLLVGAGGATADATLAASSTETKTVTVNVVVPEGKSVLLISWLNQTCSAESSGSSKDSKSKDSKSKDSKSKDSKSKDSKSKDSKSKDSKSKDSKSKDSKSKDSKSKDGGDKVSVCHIPPGNPANKQTLSIDKSALSAHLGHGDSEGACLVCANFAVSTVKAVRLGDTGLGAYIAGAVNKRNVVLIVVIALIAAAGMFGMRLLDRRPENR